MGSIYYGPNSDCYNCKGCGRSRACDNCSARCCQNNMSDHRQLRIYENSFGSEVNDLRLLTYKKCINIINNLETSHGIYIYITHVFYNFDYIIQSRVIINKMISKKNNIKNEASYINIDHTLEGKINNLVNDHKRKMNKIKEDFNEKVENIKNNPELKKLNKEIDEKNDEKNKLNNVKINSENYKDINDFQSEQIQRLNKMFDENKRYINSKYSKFENIIEPIMEYSIQEKNEKNYLLNYIKGIQKYKDFPKFKYIINKFKLDYYLL
jgi:hypothetical protein